MIVYVKDLTKQMEIIEQNIKKIKKEIDFYTTQGAMYDKDKR